MKNQSLPTEGKNSDKQKILFPCCNQEALGFRQCLKIEGVIWNTAKCPRCGKIFKLTEWKKP